MVIPTPAGRKVGSLRTCVRFGKLMLTNDEQTTARAADLAEWIVDEISEADQDWRAIELRARELVELVARRAAGLPAPARETARRSGGQA